MIPPALTWIDPTVATVVDAPFVPRRPPASPKTRATLEQYEKDIMDVTARPNYRPGVVVALGRGRPEPARESRPQGATLSSGVDLAALPLSAGRIPSTAGSANPAALSPASTTLPVRSVVPPTSMPPPGASSSVSGASQPPLHPANDDPPPSVPPPDTSSSVSAASQPPLHPANEDPPPSDHSTSPQPPNGSPSPSGRPASPSRGDISSSISDQQLHASSAKDHSTKTVTRKKRSEMGPEERRIAKEENAQSASRLNADIIELQETLEHLYESIAADHGISKERVQKLAHQAPALQKKKKASDFNVMVYIKGKELNEGMAKGHKKTLAELQAIVRKDNECQAILTDKSKMLKARALYDDSKADEALGKRSRVSRRAGAHEGRKSIDLMQDQSRYLHEVTGAVTFGCVVRRDFDSSVVSGFFGTGPVDEFLRDVFGKGCTEFVQVMEAWVTKREKMGVRKLSSAEVVKETVHMIGRRLEEVTGVKGITMSYKEFERKIVLPHRVEIEGWPEGVDRVSPQKLPADAARTLYHAWKDNTARWVKLTLVEHKAVQRELEASGDDHPKPRAKRSDAGKPHNSKKRRAAETDSDSDEEEDDVSRPSKKSRTSTSSRGKNAGPKTSAKDISSAGRAAKNAGGKARVKDAKSGVRKNTVKGSRAGPGRSSAGARPKPTKKGPAKRRASGKSKEFVVDSDEEGDDGANEAGEAEGEEPEARETDEED